MRVLIIKLSSMGDIIHTLPALTDAQQACSDIQFDWIIEKDFSIIPTWHPIISKIIPINMRKWCKNINILASYKEFFIFKNFMKKNYYDVIIDAQGLIKSAILTSFIKGEKHGMDFYSVREPLSIFFYDKCYYIKKNQHAVERIRQLFAYSLNYFLPNKKGEYAILNQFSNVKISNKPYFIFIHATTHKKKLWPEYYWRKLINFVGIHLNYLIKLPWGNNKEYSRASRLAERFKHVIVLPHLTLKQLAYEIVGAKALVSVDTGLSHLAAALNRPNLTLYGPTDPTLIGGYGKNQWFLCAKDKKMENIKVEYVWKILNKIYEL
ncbi:lipopolysaccharide heptosyltransferase RfaC [Candidatus Schneideria nysicola]|uniref:lipopolysaccharide heptosyltransferase RfaC n=1 Tax=Candidatus Schneideria nysicola TaxID=1081631 RepID=UPI001CAA4262|nr:lipopolysaccharide heptosyltransferase RfaC [Candidatus Schneideria nysicola]UAJ66168.1 lipopolysaccharide heptosyltransferase RfaC [Candidatus Schneideria nysicola]